VTKEERLDSNFSALKEGSIRLSVELGPRVGSQSKKYGKAKKAGK